jgi:transposase
MARPYSDDLRERVAALVLSGRTCRETARLFGVSVASAVKWSQRRRASGSAGAKPRGGKRQRVLLGERDWLLSRLAEQPELTVRALAAELAARGIKVSPNTVWSLLRASGRSFKKNAVRRRAGPASNRPAASAVEKVPRLA